MSSRERDPESAVSFSDPVEETGEQTGEKAEAPKRKLDINVAITDAGPCKKHLKITIPRAEIDLQFEESLSELRRDAVVPGFRPGRAPKQLVVKRFKKEVSNQVKQKLLMTSLEQIDADHQLDPITQPRLDIEAIELPEHGPMNFEMDIEVRPQFDLPNYKGFKIRRPIIEVTEKDVDTNVTRVLEEYGQLVPKLDGAAEIGDHITADLCFLRPDGRLINEVKEVKFRLQPELRFQNGTSTGLGAALTGAKPGDVREVEAKLGSAVDDPSLRGQTVSLRVQLIDLKYTRLPELNPEFLHSIGFEDMAEMREWVRAALNRRAQAEERRVIRRQIVDLLLRQAPFDLPADLVSREEKNTIARLVDQLKREGMSDNEIKARAAEIRANAHETTMASLKELLILLKIADVEEIKVGEPEIEREIETMAEKSEESPRRIRAQLE
ncbi:MAG TPA: trigger factor, partial [Isosphaeraceae bacterium]|nr:trigger factor [Isosphaeraceae bacterium]